MAGKTRIAAIDWPGIRQRYESTGRRDVSTRQIARDHGITEAAVRKKAKAERWLRRDQREYLLYGRRSGLGAEIVDWPRPRLQRGPSPVRPYRGREDRKISSQDLIDGLSRAAQSLLSELQLAIDRREIIIKMIEEWEPGTGRRLPIRYSALEKEIDIKRLATALHNMSMVCETIADLSSRVGTGSASSKR